MANTILPGYEMQVGDKLEVICDHTGPASYSNVVTNGGGGDVVSASDFNRGGIEEIAVDAVSSSGLYGVTIYAAKMKAGVAVPSVVLRWYNLSQTTGATTSEVANGTNLSAESVRMQVRLV
jgi:hypothetical protein